MEFKELLLSIGIIEKDINNESMWTWIYPTLSYYYKRLLYKKCQISEQFSKPNSGTRVPFYICHHQHYWFYMHHSYTIDSSKLPKVKEYVLMIQSSELNPDKYKTLLMTLSDIYNKNGNPVPMLQQYLSVALKGFCLSLEKTTLVFDEPFIPLSEVASFLTKTLVKTLGLDIILIYTALLLKKRIVVYHHHLSTLQNFVWALPLLVSHRLDWDMIYPYMEISDEEILELENLNNYVAGFIDASIERRPDIYDLFVNLAAYEITVAPHARESLTMTKVHKDIAVFLTQQAEMLQANQQFIKVIEEKTKNLISTIKEFFTIDENGKSAIIQPYQGEHKLNPALEQFFWSLGVAEGFIVT